MRDGGPEGDGSQQVAVEPQMGGPSEEALNGTSNLSQKLVRGVWKAKLGLLKVMVMVGEPALMLMKSILGD